MSKRLKTHVGELRERHLNGDIYVYPKIRMIL